MTGSKSLRKIFKKKFIKLILYIFYKVWWLAVLTSMQERIFFRFSETFDNLEPENMNFGIYLTRPITNLTLLIHFHETMAWIIYNWMHSRPICNHAHPISTLVFCKENAKKTHFPHQNISIIYQGEKVFLLEFDVAYRSFVTLPTKTWEERFFRPTAMM